MKKGCFGCLSIFFGFAVLSGFMVIITGESKNVFSDFVLILFFLALALLSFYLFKKIGSKKYPKSKGHQTITTPQEQNEVKLKSKIELTSSDVNKPIIVEEKDNFNTIKIESDYNSYETIDINDDNLNSNDLLVLHLNNKRMVGNETRNYFYFREHQINIDHHIERLINNNVLTIKNDFETSLPYLKIPELKQILRENNLKLGGNKKDLIERIKNNLKENEVKLPKVYIATSIGDELIKNTDYIPYFYNSFIISLGAAKKIVDNHNNIDDKIEFIYLFLINRFKNSEKNTHKLHEALHGLLRYYKSTNQNENLIRQYTNYSIYLSMLSSLKNLKYLYNDNNNLLEHFFFSGISNIEYYENQLFIENKSRELLKKLFYLDVKEFEMVDKDLCNDFCELIFAEIYSNHSISLNDLPTIKKSLK